MDFNLNDLDTVTLAEVGITVPLKKLDGDPLLNALGQPVTLTVHGFDSAVYRKASREMARNNVSRAQKNREAKVSDEQLDAAENDALALLCACTKGWDGVLDSKNKAVPFSADAIAEFYRRFPPARDQADNAVMNRALFIKPSSEGSSSTPDIDSKA